MRAQRPIAIGLLALLSCLVVGCGGGGAATEPSEAPTAPAVVKKADAICRDVIRQLQGIGHGALRGGPSTALELTTERLIRPTIPVLARAGKRLAALHSAAHNDSFDLFTNLFDPAIVLAQKRLAAGRRGDQTTSRGLEEQLTNLGDTQRRAAQNAGLVDCDVDFQRVLVGSLSE